MNRAKRVPPKVPQVVMCRFSWPAVRRSAVGEEYRDKDPHFCIRRPGHKGDHKCACGRKHEPTVTLESK